MEALSVCQSPAMILSLTQGFASIFVISGKKTVFSPAQTPPPLT